MAENEIDFTLFEKRKLEARKLQVDYMKHLTTLNTASLVLMATFLTNFAKNPKVIWIALLSFISFIISIIGCLIMQGHCVIEVEKGEYTKSNLLLSFAFISAFVGFGLGLVFLAIFSFLNF